MLPWRNERLRQENEGRREIERAEHERELVEHERDRLREERDRLENELEAIRISASVRCYRMSFCAPAIPVPRSKVELEVTDVDNLHTQNGQMSFGVRAGRWSDGGAFESLHRANDLVARRGANSL